MSGGAGSGRRAASTAATSRSAAACRRASTAWKIRRAPPSAAALKRGNVSLTLTIASERQASRCASIARCWPSWRGLVEEVRKGTGAAAPTADGLLRVRGVIEEEDEREESEEALAALDQALSRHARRGR